MMTLDEYRQTIHDWTREVEAHAVSLFELGVHPHECTGIAINIVESKRKKRQVEQQSLTIPGNMAIRRN